DTALVGAKAANPLLAQPGRSHVEVQDHQGQVLALLDEADTSGVLDVALGGAPRDELKRHLLLDLGGEVLVKPQAFHADRVAGFFVLDLPIERVDAVHVLRPFGICPSPVDILEVDGDVLDLLDHDAASLPVAGSTAALFTAAGHLGQGLSGHPDDATSASAAPGGLLEQLTRSSPFLYRGHDVLDHHFGALFHGVLGGRTG